MEEIDIEISKINKDKKNTKNITVKIQNWH